MEEGTLTMTIYPRTAFSRPGNAAHYNSDNVDLAWQSELPTSVSIRGWRPGRKRSIGADLAAHFGGTWKFVPGLGCPGQWSGDNLTPAQIVAVAEAFDATIVCYLYANHTPAGIPAEFAGSPAYRNTDGYYSTPAR